MDRRPGYAVLIEPTPAGIRDVEKSSVDEYPMCRIAERVRRPLDHRLCCNGRLRRIEKKGDDSLRRGPILHGDKRSALAIQSVDAIKGKAALRRQPSNRSSFNIKRR